MSASPKDLSAKTSGLTRKDFQTDQEVRWCPGCGDYAILAQVQRLMPELGIERHNIVFISGIGCSSRFPYYMNTYGMHSIHGRAPAIATGLKATRPELSVWVVTGDGDALSIGGNHTVHMLRRNVDLKILLFNNRIYGLTKGQYSPTSELGKKTKSTPYGSLDAPFSPVRLALGAGASFIARTVDVEAVHLTETLRRATAHRGSAFIEILQNCNVFNDGAFAHLTDKPTKADTQLLVVHGKPWVFGKGGDKAIRLNRRMEPEVFRPGVDGDLAEAVVHDEQNEVLGFVLSKLEPPTFPTPLGVFCTAQRPTFDALLNAQEREVIAKKGDGDLESLLNGGDTWMVS
jgi:2-oxoglutarate ferredoxin oxidoreductase subunit beta